MQDCYYGSAFVKLTKTRESEYQKTDTMLFGGEKQVTDAPIKLQAFGTTVEL